MTLIFFSFSCILVNENLMPILSPVPLFLLQYANIRKYCFEFKTLNYRIWTQELKGKLC